MASERLRSGGCLSYLVGCEQTCAGVIVDPTLELLDRYAALATEKGLRVRYVIDSHTHADHFSAARELARQLRARIVMHRLASAPFADIRVDDGERLVIGELRIRVIHTPGHTDDSVCLVLPDRVLTGDTLLIGGTGRTDLPTGDPDALFFPAHAYKGRASSTLGAEERENPRLLREPFRQTAAARRPPRRRELPDPTVRVLAYCQYGKISTLAAATLRTMGYIRAVALDGGMEAWAQASYPIEKGATR